ncbi:hypothetical protein [Bacillus pseudomycoides]|uniref:Uncharacterized protein n=1 Tax=Bacillus pseudomycoides TaxID=64104 RepID=A0ABD6TFM3_9BACI|nr:hypothetical protein [Bacillus pseudomycoides]PFW93895.1 hypothetical protein COL29_12190 [Bacillus pseudomycoides]PFX36078.1 hypothetical protein COL32_29200 [Bacillus pseudomycoides]PGA76460.1 hypothetical protein COL87_01170 [Bacillus pseudomycoides]PGC41209.1 hypothetical protein COM18_11800 [Bacillus pseudomycoides]PHE92367.1 hypothetical protein COF78_17385 [Bacillus pseudomycoides]
MTVKIIEKSFSWHLSNEEEGEDTVDCIMHWYEIHEDIEEDDDYVGDIIITIGNREQFEFTIWNGGGCVPEGEKPNFEDHYVCLPTMLEVSEDDPLEIISIGDLLAYVG